MANLGPKFSASIWKICVMDNLFISLQYPLSSQSSSDWYIPTTRLTSLTISGRAFDPAFTTLPLPQLQVLCLHKFQFNAEDAITFPPFPKLHTLQLSRTNGWKAYHKVFNSIAKLPSLTCLELYENDYQSSLAANEYSLPDIPHLQRLRAFGTYEYILFSTRWIESPTLARLCDLGVGVADNGYDSLDEWEIPPTMERFMVAMRLDLPDTSKPQPKPLRYLHWFLQRNSDHIARGVLREVVVLGLTWHPENPWSKEEVQEIVDLLLHLLPHLLADLAHGFRRDFEILK